MCGSVRARSLSVTPQWGPCSLYPGPLSLPGEGTYLILHSLPSPAFKAPPSHFPYPCSPFPHPPLTLIRNLDTVNIRNLKRLPLKYWANCFGISRRILGISFSLVSITFSSKFNHHKPFNHWIIMNLNMNFPQCMFFPMSCNWYFGTLLKDLYTSKCSHFYNMNSLGISPRFIWYISISKYWYLGKEAAASKQ